MPRGECGRRVHGRSLGLLAVVPVLCAVAGGCAAPGPVNPSFPLDAATADAEIEAMAADPRPLERPLLVVGGFLDPGLGSWWIGRTLRRLFADPEEVLPVSFFWACDLDACRKALIDAIEARHPSRDRGWTTEVDVLALSMGGVVARAAAAPPEAGSGSSRRLRIARLFTIATPHRGAAGAGVPWIHPLQDDLRYGSAFLERLDIARREADWALYPYVRLQDGIVGARNAAPIGEHPWWLSNGPFAWAHVASAIDVRILADVARRLRGEAPYASEPRAPLPMGIR